MSKKRNKLVMNKLIFCRNHIKGHISIFKLKTCAHNEVDSLKTVEAHGSMNTTATGACHTSELYVCNVFKYRKIF